jgi:integrase
VWVGKLSLGTDEQGRRRRRVVYGRDKAAVVEQLARLRAQALDGTLGDPLRATTAEFLRRWLEDVARTTVGPKSYELYEMMTRRHLVPHVGSVRLSKLAPMHLQTMLATMERRGASPRLRQLALSILSRAVRVAVRWQMLPRNPADAVTPPHVSRPEIHPLTIEQVVILMDAAHDDRLYALYVLAVGTGLRQGELLGLQWLDVDLVGGVLHVCHQLHEVNSGRLWLGDLKTAKAKRRVDLPALAVEALREHRQRMLAEGHPHGFVFCDTDGGPIRKSNLTRRSFHPLLRRAGLPHIRFHDLRHTHATLLLSQGVHPKVVQERLGHAVIGLTLDTYSHTLPSMGREAAAKLDDLLRAGLGADPCASTIS